MNHYFNSNHKRLNIAKFHDFVYVKVYAYMEKKFDWFNEISGEIRTSQNSNWDHHKMLFKLTRSLWLATTCNQFKPN